MRCSRGWGIGALVFISVLTGWAQTYGPGEIQYGGITLRFSGRLTTVGTCSPATQPGPGVTQIQCQVPEGVAGTIELTATRTPAGAVNIRMESPPAGWPSSFWTRRPDGTWVDSRSPVASGWGTVSAQYRFTPPAGSVGKQFALRFKAWTPGIIGELELRVVLDIVRAVTPTEPVVSPSYGPFTGTTDGAGRFEVPIPTLPNTAVTGKLTECTVRILPRTQVSVTLVPKPGVTIRSVGDIGAVRVSSPGYIETEIVQLMLASSMDMFGRTHTTADVGTVCLRPPTPTTPVTPPPVTPTGPITGTTDSAGKFTASPLPGTTVTGTLTECGKIPLPNQTFTLTMVPKGKAIATAEDIAGFTFTVPGYGPTTVTKFSVLSLFGLTWYDTGTVCLPPPCTCEELGVVAGNPRITGWLQTIEITGDRAWVQVDISLPVTWTINCIGQPPPPCQAAIKVAANAAFNPLGFVPGPKQTRLWTPTLRCGGPCPGTTTRRSEVRYSFIVEARQVVGMPLAEVLPYDANVVFTLAPVGCPGVQVQFPVRVGLGVPGGGAPPNPNPPPPPLPLAPIPLPINPDIRCDPYVEGIESIDPLPTVTPPPVTPTGPFTGTTDGAGRFEVPIPTLPNTSVTGKLTECTVRPLPNTQVSVTLVPKPGVTIRSVGDIGAVRVSSPGYIETEIVQLMLASSMDIFGRTYATVDTGTVCLRPTAPHALLVLIRIRIGNNGTQPARVRLDVTVLLEDGTTAMGVMDDLILVENTESTVEVLVPISAPPSGGIWPPVRGVIAEIVPYECDDDDPNNNSAEWP